MKNSKIQFVKEKILLLLLILTSTSYSLSQNEFTYSVAIEAVNMSGIPPLHSYAIGQHDSKLLIIGGRKDGLHARQPFAAFPASHNNTDLYVIDIEQQQVWGASVNSLPNGIKEQLQSTNMNFHQDSDTLYIIGGYAYSATANNWITFPAITSVTVSSAINAIMNGSPLQSSFKQSTNEIFAVTGGYLGKIDDTYYLVGGHRFDGRYNPVGGATYTQQYTNQIQKFQLNNSGTSPVYSNYSALTDPVHLRRRDYNLLPQIFPDGQEGYLISSGVFQSGSDLPFLYPVDIKSDGYNPRTEFNQYLSHYHSAKVSLFDSINNENHSLFFGGMSQYYYQNGALIQDNLVPFVNTISRLTRHADNSFTEYQLPISMPGFRGSSAEFIVNTDLPQYSSTLIKLNEIEQDTILLGYILGGIYSPSLNPFANNQTNTTSADPSLFAVYMYKDVVSAVQAIDGSSPYRIKILLNPVQSFINIAVAGKEAAEIRYFLNDMQGKIILQGMIEPTVAGFQTYRIALNKDIKPQIMSLTLVFDNKYYHTEKVIVVR
ncbi:MAG: hypothetical protein Q8J88_18080 [Bacteroidales bacterium]|nr:hypothetical protein [Bacteroidales bacterium]